MDKALNVCYLAKEYYPEETSLDLRMSGCYLRLGKTDESAYFLSTVKNSSSSPHLLWLFSPNLPHKSGHKTPTRSMGNMYLYNEMGASLK